MNVFNSHSISEKDKKLKFRLGENACVKHNMGLNPTKTACGISIKVMLKQACSATETG